MNKKKMIQLIKDKVKKKLAIFRSRITTKE